MNFGTYEKPYKIRLGMPGISLYLMPHEAAEMDTIKCLWCGRPFADVKGIIDKVITVPLAVKDYDVAINIRCKLCKQHYRFITIG